MRPTSYQSEDLDRLLRKHKIAALDDLKTVLGTDVDYDHVVETLTSNGAIILSTNGFCHGERGAVRTCSIPRPSTRLSKYAP